jgi:hypothetical protein
MFQEATRIRCILTQLRILQDSPKKNQFINGLPPRVIIHHKGASPALNLSTRGYHFGDCRGSWVWGEEGGGEERREEGTHCIIRFQGKLCNSARQLVAMMCTSIFVLI